MEKNELKKFYKIAKDMLYDDFKILTHDESLEEEERDFFYNIQEYFLQKKQDEIIKNQKW